MTSGVLFCIKDYETMLLKPVLVTQCRPTITELMPKNIRFITIQADTFSGGKIQIHIHFSKDDEPRR